MKLPGAAHLLAVLLVAASATLAGDEGAVNATCPVMLGKRVRKSVFSVYEGKTIGFC